MFRINFYQTRQGRQPVKEYIDNLQAVADNNKESRVKLKKIFEYMEILAQHGTRAGQPYVKHDVAPFS